MGSKEDLEALTVAGSDVQLLVVLLKLASIIGRPMKECVSERHKIAPNDLQVLMCLAGEGTLAGQEIATVMAMTPMNVSRSLAALERLGWTTRVTNEGNRRRRPVQLSAKGWEAYGAMLPDVRSVARRLFQPFDKHDRMEFGGHLKRLIHQVETWDEADGPAPTASAGPD
jgi:DNA-binding MarR family transcriptional regulator